MAPIVAAANTPAGFFIPEADGYRSVAGAVRVSARAGELHVDGHPLIHEQARTLPPRAGAASGIGRKWGQARTAWPLLQSIEYPDLYPGITLRLSFERAALKADYLLAPGADPRDIRFRYTNARTTLDGTDLIVDFGTSRLRHRRPVAFEASGTPVECEWLVFEDGSAGFRTGPYHRSEPLIIDPYITSSTMWIGGSRSDAVTAMAAVPGAMLIAGWTESQTLLPSTLAPRGSEDVQAFVMKVNNTTGAVEYATWIGGTGYDLATAITADAGGNAYVTGYTSSDGLATAGAAQTVRSGGTDAFLVRLTAQGAVSWATYAGGTGTDRARSVALTPSGSVWIAGETDSANLPVLSPVQPAFGGGASDAFAARYSAAGTREYATWLGGSGTDQANGIAADSASNVYLTGFTESWNFPVANALQSPWGGGQDAFVTKLAADGRSIAYSTFLGGSLGSAAQPETGNAIAVDASGVAIVAGSAASVNFPVAGSLSAFRGGTDAFLVRVHPSGTSLLAGTLYGDSGSDTALALTTTADGSVYFAGSTSSEMFSDHGGWQSAGGALDGFVVRLGPASQLAMASRVGGGGNDAVNAIAVAGSALYVAGQTSSSAFSTGSSPKAMPDGFLLKLDEIPVNIDLNSSPSGRTIHVSGSGCAARSYVTPVRLAWTVGSSCTLSVDTPQTAGETRWRFVNWSNGSTAAAMAVYATSAGAAYTAQFTPEYRLTSSVTPSGAGTLSPSPTSADGFYPAGTVVQFSAAAGTGWQFSSWSGGGPAVVMDGPKSVTATFATAVYDAMIAAPAGLAWSVSGTGCGPGSYSGTVTLRWTHGAACSVSIAAVQGGTDTRWRFTRWADGSTGNPRAFTGSAGSWSLQFSTEYRLTTMASPSGAGTVTVNPSSADGFYAAPTTVHLSASAAAGWQFASWSGGASVVMDGPKSVTATFSSAEYDAVIAVPSGLAWTATGTGCSPGSYSGTVTLRWTHGSTCSVSIAAVQGGPETRWRFTGWSDGSTANPRTFSATAAGSWTAQFAADYRLTAAVSPSGAGTVAVNPSSADGFYAAGASVQLSASPAAGWQFASWSGGGASVAMDGPKSVTATFTSADYDAVIAVPSGLAWTATGTGCSPGSYSGTVTLRWRHGSTCSVSMAAVQGGADTRWRFTGWSDGSTANPRTFSAAAGSWTPSFRAEYRLAVSVSPLTGGSVNVTPASLDGYYTADTAVQLTATPASGYRFLSWAGTNMTTIVMNEPRTVVAQFGAQTPPAPVSVAPTSGSGETQTFTAVYATSGAAIEKAFWVAGDRSGVASCLIEYSAATRQFRLMADDGANWSAPAAAGSAASLANSQCSLAAQSSGGQTTAAGMETRLELRLAVSFAAAFRGDRKIHLLAVNESLSLNSGWMEAGMWKVTAGAPSVSSLTPDVSTGTSGTYTAVFQHSGGTSELYLGYILFLPTPNIIWYTARGSCLIEYNRISNGIRLINETGDGWLGPIQGVAIHPNAQPLANSRCQVNVAGSRASVTEAGMSVTVPVTFREGFTGVLGTFLQAQDVHGNWTGMTQFGNVTAYPQTSPKPGPYISTVSILPTAGNSPTITLTTGHTGGYSQLGMIHLLVSDRIVGGLPCQIVYFPHGNILNLVNDSGTDMVTPAGIKPGSGALANSRCSVTGLRSSAVAWGNSVSLTIALTFQPSTFAGKRNVYANAFDIHGNLTHWVHGGTLNIQ